MTDERADGESPRISLVAHHVFCHCRAWLEAMGKKTDTHQMAVGLDKHYASEGQVRSRRIGSLSPSLSGRPFIEA